MRHTAFTRGLAALLAVLVALPAAERGVSQAWGAEASDSETDAPSNDEVIADPGPTQPESEADLADSAERPEFGGMPVPPADGTAKALDGALDAAKWSTSSDGWPATPATPVAIAGPSAGKSAATPQAVPLPSAQGSVQGMGESVSASLSSGAATFSVPIAIPAGRAGVQPNLALTYSSASGDGLVGLGWSLSAPFISRESNRGLPRYVDHPSWHPEEDRFFYNGGEELVPVDGAAVELADCGAPGCAPIPAELAGWQQYRTRVEGVFMRFFRDPERTRWVVQAKDGTRFDFGVLPAEDGPAEMIARSPSALQSEEPGGTGRVYRWLLTRISDAHGSGIYYAWDEDQGQRYLADIYYGSPHATCAAAAAADARRRCAAPLEDYGRRVHFVYEGRPDVFTSYLSGWEVRTTERLRRVEVTAAPGGPGARTLVRRYHFGYDDVSFVSLLVALQVEGRPEHSDPVNGAIVGADDFGESTLGDEMVGALLPPMRFHYTEQPAAVSAVPGFGGVDDTVRVSPASPPMSVGAEADLFDVNSDGLPDLLVTESGRYHTIDGEPAVGVFFNGFIGADAVPAATAGTFSDPVPVAMRSDLSSVLSLANANIVPMDVDGDGRADLLHMPRRADYGYFTPLRSGADDAVSPAEQGWLWAHVDRGLPAGELDPRIDLTADSEHIRVFDVNNDHLVDVVQTTGTSIQTWLNLGWLPDGDGRFGSYWWNEASGAWELSTAPIESCLPVAGTPLDFADPEVRLGDMNADGLQDIVRVRRDRVIYWPGAGEGRFGVGGACAPGLAAARHVEMATPPAELNPELGDVFLVDVNADGADDVVQVRFHDVDVWFNRLGASFTDRLVVPGTPFLPLGSRVRIADIDGSGTADIVYANGGNWRWVDLMGGTHPRLLAAVENSMGALTQLEYGSSAEDYLTDLREALACTDPDCERFTWSQLPGDCDEKVLAGAGECAKRPGGSPVIATVVRQIDTSDRLDVVGVAPTQLTTRYHYHDGYYEGIEQEYRGFGATDVEHEGDDVATTLSERHYLHQGRRANAIASDRLADNRDQALEGLPFLVEAKDGDGRYLGTTHTSYTLRPILTGLNGLAVMQAYAAQTDDVRYDVAGFEGSRATLSLPGVTRPNGTTMDTVRVRGTRWAHVRTTVDEIDALGQVRRATDWGRLRGEIGEPLPNEQIVSHADYQNVGASGWMWRIAADWIDGYGDSTQLSRTTYSYNAAGDPEQQVTDVDQPVPLPFAGDGEAQDWGSPRPEDLITSTTHDVWGNPTILCGGGDATTGAGCLRHATLTYDSDYKTVVESQSIATSSSGGGFDVLTSTIEWDRALGLVLTATNPNGDYLRASYDGLGRVTALKEPPVNGCEGSMPRTRITYHTPEDPAAEPVTRVHTTTFLSCSDPTQTLESYDYLDGLGRSRASLVTGDDDGTRRWVKSGIALFNRSGEPERMYQPAYFSGPPEDVHLALARPTIPSVQALHDAFGRVVVEIAEDGARTQSFHHALSVDVCDALALEPGGPFQGTCSTTRLDGHGQVVDRVLRNRQPGTGDTEYIRLFSTYRADGSLVSVTRAQTSADTPTAPVLLGRSVTRAFMYDTVGRRVAGTDPDTDNPSTGSTWRYLYNRVGDLVAVRDPRGCGANYYLDLAGRGIGEAYVSCGEAQVHEAAVTTVPAGSVGWTMLATGQPVDARFYFDRYDDTWATNPAVFADFPAEAAGTLGLLTATIDRGQRSVLAYDARGNTVWRAKQVALLPAPGPAPATLADPLGAPGGGDAAGGVPVEFDEVHTYSSTHVYDHAGRVRGLVLPPDPDFDATETGPRLGARLDYDRRGLPSATTALIVSGGGTPTPLDGSFGFGSGATVDATPIVAQVDYLRDGLAARTVLGDDLRGTRSPTEITQDYDLRRRPMLLRALRAPTSVPVGIERPLSAVSLLHAQSFHWDAVDNLVAIDDLRLPEEWSAGHRPQWQQISHDALYRVTGVEYDYVQDGGSRNPDDLATDWRNEMTRVESADPMRTRPAPMLASRSEARVVSLTWQYDWLANMTHWGDDAHAFFERSIGAITNGADLDAGKRPSALYLAADLAGPPGNRGGYVELQYGAGGNVVAMTAHAQCQDAGAEECHDPGGADLGARQAAIHAACTCASGQHYAYRWDELNRLSDARRYDRTGDSGSGSWALVVRQRYRYDAANVRVLKQTLDADPTSPAPERVALYVFPGDLERRGLHRGLDAYDADPLLETETQYLVGGARIVWEKGDPLLGIDADHRITYAVGDLIGSTSAVVDLRTGELVEQSTRYPNGMTETLLAEESGVVPVEPRGFTGKEGDGEVGLVYFGERYLIAAIGRWASPDPLQIYSLGGGEALNSYHYISGSLLQSTDPIGLDAKDNGQVKDADLTIRVAGERGAILSVRISEKGFSVVRDSKGNPISRVDAQRVGTIRSWNGHTGRYRFDVKIAQADGSQETWLSVYHFPKKAERGALLELLTWIPIIGDAISGADVGSSVGEALREGNWRRALKLIVLDAAIMALPGALHSAGGRLGGSAADEVVEGGVAKRVGAKRGPKTDPGAPHNATIRNEADKLEEEGNTILAGGGRKKERAIPTPGGKKGKRRPDILYETPTGEVRGRNVGRTNADGTPVKREVDALEDLNDTAGVPTDFKPYDR